MQHSMRTMKPLATKKKLYFLALVFGGFFFTLYLNNGAGAEDGAKYTEEGAEDKIYGAGARDMKGAAVNNGI